jgi:DNA-binding winged helix-turn-helix (wHTH) protein
MMRHVVQNLDGIALVFGPFRFFPLQRIILRAGAPLRLGSRAREILVVLVERAGAVVNKRELIARVWPDTIVEEGTLRVHIAALRRALGEGGWYVENVTGRGYRFVAPVMHVEDAPVSGRVKNLGVVIRSEEKRIGQSEPDLVRESVQFPSF